MSFLSLDFVIFAFLVAVIYFILPAKAQWIWLLIASVYIFYTKSAWYQQVNLLTFLVINYIVSIIMSKQKEKRKIVFICLLIFDILYLLTFKYFSFFKPFLVGIGLPQDSADIANLYLSELSPAGISYITLIIIGYITDLYWENVSVQKNPGKFVLFSLYFPQIVSGPLVKYEEQDGNLWGEKHRFSYDRTVSGLERILWGVFKKLVISARAGIVAETIHGSLDMYQGFYIPVAVLFYIIQLYTDFSGLMDIVLGLSEILGISMPENFNTPFYSESIAEFWRRWHITLGRFLKDYVLFPLQMSGFVRKLRKAYKKAVGKELEKKINLPRYLTSLISWIIIGFWHGGGFNYIFGVGIYMWLIIVLEELLEPVIKKLTDTLRINTEAFSWHLLRRVKTFVLYMFGVSFFFANTLEEGFMMVKATFSSFNPWIFFDKSIYELGLDRTEMNILVIGIALMFIVSHIKQRGSVREVINKQNFAFRVLLYLVLFIMIVTFGHYGAGFDSGSFIYGRF